MSDGKLTIPLDVRTDENGKKYYIAKLKGPFTIDCTHGIACLIFVSEENAEEMQISSIAPPKKQRFQNE